MADWIHSYNDEEPVKAAPPAAPEPAPAPAAEPAAPTTRDDEYNHFDQAADGDAGDDSHMNGAEEYEDDEDDVDFNLGNGDSHAPDTDSYHNGPAPVQQRGPGPNSKEDG